MISSSKDGLSQCLYRSRARPDLKAEDVRAILEASRRNNPAQGISGKAAADEGGAGNGGLDHGGARGPEVS